MKRMITIAVLIVICQSMAFSQDDYNRYYSITIAKLKNGSAFIELSNNSSLVGDKKYWIAAKANIALQSGLVKAKKWANLNQIKHVQFEKEVIRSYFMDKDTYLFHGYVSGFTREVKLMFNGYSDGNFICILSFEEQGNGYVYYSFSTIEDLDKMIKMLQGKSIDKIDEIFN